LPALDETDEVLARDSDEQGDRAAVPRETDGPLLGFVGELRERSLGHADRDHPDGWIGERGDLSWWARHLKCYIRFGPGMRRVAAVKVMDVRSTGSRNCG
jgi:hypothetical protein